MSFYKNFTSAVGALAIAACFVSHANAESGSFTLPFQAHWGYAVLQPGEYKYSVPSGTSWPQTIELTRAGHTVYARAMWEGIGTEEQRSELLLRKLGGTTVVTDLKLGPDGKTFHFSIPKALRSELAKNRAGSTKIVTLVPASQ